MGNPQLLTANIVVDHPVLVRLASYWCLVFLICLCIVDHGFHDMPWTLLQAGDIHTNVGIVYEVCSVCYAMCFYCFIVVINANVANLEFTCFGTASV